jgi:hypothetical protein
LRQPQGHQAGFRHVRTPCALGTVGPKGETPYLAGGLVGGLSATEFSSC